VGRGLWVVGAVRFRGAGFQGFGHSHGFVGDFDFRQVVENLLGLGRFDAHREAPALVGEFRTLEDGERGSQANGGRSGRVIEQAPEGREGKGAELAHFVV
jgi:hypothetical protein